ncbi:MAG: prolipoprotein diacylglyceryl transferase [Hyphomonadaceae bacterium]
MDPAALTIPGFELFGGQWGPFHLRWYALAYIAGLVLGWRWMVWLIRRDRLWAPGKPVMTVPQADDFLFWATLGVILGGRLGYVLFYKPDMIWQSPAQILQIWQGGMSFHGGLIGVALASLWFARRNNIALLGLGDLAAAATPIGLFFGRLANFINGELWGRPTDAPWGMVFCSETIRELNYGSCPAGSEPRHPSQLYEAALEGVALFAIINVLTLRYDSLRKPGMNVGVFLICYGLFRALMETVREPDAHMPEALRGVITMGMLLSIPMILIGAWLVHRALKTAPAKA